MFILAIIQIKNFIELTNQNPTVLLVSPDKVSVNDIQFPTITVCADADADRFGLRLLGHAVDVNT